ncbi:MAG: hypothetical protein GWP10_08505 [Nitrospiraceae bacterium]|nr:hypothetical protein [Nitrospiraceae bacterium]
MKKLIVFTIDDNYVMPFCAAVASFIDHHNVQNYTIGLIYSTISKKKLDRVRSFFAKNKLELKVKKIKDPFKNIEVSYHFNSVIFYRFLIPSLYKEYRKILYIDSDILFLDNIDDVFNIALSNYILAAIPRTFLGIPAHMKDLTKEYFASGLLLINTQLFIENNILEKSIKFLKTSQYEMPDQDALNAVVMKWEKIDLRYGIETAFLESNLPVLKKAKSDPAIIQFSGSSKPWQYMNDHPYKDLYWHYLKKTPFKNYKYEDYSFINAIKKHTPKPIKQLIKKAIGIK